MGRWWGVLLLLAVAALVAYPQALSGDQGSTAWSQPVAITVNRDYAATPTLVYTSDGTAHSVWEDQGTLLHASRPPGAQWSVPTRVAAGIMPSLAVAPDNTLHLLFSHDFIANDEIYYVNYRDGHWSLPINVSHTSGSSLLPAIAVSASGTLYAAWQDYSGGDWVIYYGQLDNRFWSSRPVPNARGQNPAIAGRPDGQIYVAWQTPLNADNPDDTDVFLAQSLPDHSWTLPVDVSDTPGSRSVGPTVVAPDGLAHVAWVENGRDVYFSFGSGVVWSAPELVASGNMAAQEAKLTTDGSELLILSWVQDQTSIHATYELVRSGEWAKPTPVAELPLADRRDLAITSRPGGGISAVWVQASADQPGLISVYQSTRPSIVKPRNWLPLLVHE